MSVIGYARVSTPEQDTTQQEDALASVGCLRVYHEYASGSLTKRPELERCLARLHEGDTLVVWRLDRLGRDTHHLLTTVTGLTQRGVIVKSLHENIDSSTATGRMMLGIFAVLAEAEREWIRERTLLRLASIRARGGKLGGRKPVMTANKLRVVRELHAGRQHSLEEIAATVGVSRSTVVRSLRAARG